MGVTSFKLNTLPGARRSRSIELSKDLTAPERVRAWEANATPAGGGKHTNYFGQEKGEVSRFNRRMVLRGVNVSQENWHHIQSWRDQGEPLAISPLWDGENTLTVLPLGKPAPGEVPLQDFLIADKRSEVDFTRYSTRFHPDTGLPAGFHIPLYTDCWQGENLDVRNVIDDDHFPSFEYRAYSDRDAADVGSITRVYLDPRWDADVFWVDQLVCIQTRELTTNIHEIARVDAINSAGNYMDLSKTPAGDAVLDGTADYSYANRTSVSSNICADGDMSDSGIGSWPERGAPLLAEKSKTRNETGTQCLRFISSGGDSGVEQVIGGIPAGTNLVIWLRYKAIIKTGANSLEIQIRNSTDGVDLLNEDVDPVIGEYTWFRYSYKVADGATDPSVIELWLTGAIADPDEVCIDRIEIYQNAVPNGGMEPLAADTYDAEGAAITTSTAANTTYAGNTCTDDGLAGLWDLSDAAVGMIAVETGGAYGRINTVNDIGLGANIVVDAWVNGPPVNGNACAVHWAVAPSWNEQIGAAPDQLWQDTDEHGGGYSQGITGNIANEGIRTVTNVLDAIGDNNWALIAGWFKVSAGSARFRSDGGAVNILQGIDSAAWEWWSTIYQIDPADTRLRVVADGINSTFLCDDICAVRLPCLTPTTEGAAFDDAVYQIPGEVGVVDGATTGAAIIGCWRPGVDNGDLPDDAYLLDISRDTMDTQNRISLFYDKANTRIEMAITSGGANVNTNGGADTFSAGDRVFFALWIDDTGAPNTETKVWTKVNQDAPVSGTNNASTLPNALSRIWIGRNGDNFGFPAMGSVTIAAIETPIGSVAVGDVEALLELMAGDTGYEAELTLLEETYGIIYEIEPNGITPWHPADGEYIKCDIALREIGRIGAFSNAY